MPCDAHLPAKHTPLADFRRAGHAHLCRHHRVLADVGVVGNLHEIVDFHAFSDVCAAHRGAVHAAVCPDFHVVFNHHVSNLRNLVVAVLRGREAEAVGTDDAAGVERHARPDAAVVVNDGVRIDDAVVAHRHALADDGMRLNLAVFADFRTLANVGEGPDVAVVTHRCGRRNEGERVDALLSGLHRLVGLQQLGHGLVGVFHADERGRHLAVELYIVVDEHHRRLRIVDVVGIFFVREEGDGSGLSLFNFGKSVDDGIRVAFDAPANHLCNLLCCKFHVFGLFFEVFS